MAKRLKTYRVDGDLDDAVTAKAASRGETVTDVIARAFREYVTDTPPARRRKPVTEPPPRPKRAPEPEPLKVTSSAGDCPHPKSDRLKGRCTRCRTFVGYT